MLWTVIYLSLISDFAKMKARKIKSKEQWYNCFYKLWVFFLPYAYTITDPFTEHQKISSNKENQSSWIIC